MTVFEDRREAGRLLAVALEKSGAVEGKGRVVVLAIPRGGLPVGAEVARALGAEFDVVVSRWLRSPNNPELGFGAVTGDGHVELDEALVEELGLTPEQVQAEIDDRKAEVRRRLELFRGVAPAVDLHGSVAVVVDDGIATGGSARQACLLARRAGAQRVVLAVPVAPRGVERELRDVADEVVVLSSPAEFLAVDQAYRDFSQLDDEDVIAALASAAGT
jgi:putative phosphoribosyl transferase